MERKLGPTFRPSGYSYKGIELWYDDDMPEDEIWGINTKNMTIRERIEEEEDHVWAFVAALILGLVTLALLALAVYALWSGRVD